MTKALSYQKETFNVKEALEYFRASNYEDCRINAYPSFTKYNGINRTSPSFLMIDIDLKDFATKDKLDTALNRILKLKLVYMAILPCYGLAMAITSTNLWQVLS
jgi:hypothetical protein